LLSAAHFEILGFCSAKLAQKKKNLKEKKWETILYEGITRDIYKL
jgi:hypothetical protein